LTDPVRAVTMRAVFRVSRRESASLEGGAGILERKPRMERKHGAVLACLGLLILGGSLLLVDPARGYAAPPPGEKDVRVINTPAEPVPVAGSVTVGNAAGSPVPVRDVDRQSKQNFSWSWAVSIAPGNEFAPPLEFSVPAGKVLVIETVSMKVELPAGQNLRAAFATFSGGVASEFYLPLVAGDFGGFRRHQGTFPVRVHADPGVRVWTLVHRDSDVGGGAAWFNVAGYLVDAP
jgi:hypothetical protein